MRAALLLVGLIGSTVVSAQTGNGPHRNTYEIAKLADGVYALIWTTPVGSPVISNSTFIVGQDDVIVVDTGLSGGAGEVILEGLRKVTSKPVSMVINTHWHGGHIFGNQAFRRAFPAARFAAHAATREGIITGELGYRRIEVLHLGHANTPGDIVVHLPSERIVIHGDMAITPMQFAFLSSPRAWVATLERLAALDAATFVPGHGPVQSGTRFIADLQTMLRSVIDQVDGGLKEGLDLEALKARVKVVPPAGSVYEKASAASLDRNFRLPATESALREKGATVKEPR